MTEVVIGKVQDYLSFPTEVDIEERRFFLIYNEGVYTLVSRICPHMGYTVEYDKGELVCHVHEWTFEPLTGVCNELPNECLRSYAVDIKNDELIAII